MARLFIALALPERIRRRLGEEADRLRLAGASVAWVKRDNYHLTLRFLGETKEEELLEVQPFLDEVVSSTPAIPLVARGLGVFPDAARPRVVWCGLEGAGEAATADLLTLRQRIDRGIRKLGFRPEKNFRAHVTLGRIRGPEHQEDLIERLGPGTRREFGHFEAREVVLFDSSETREGRCYTPVHVARLA